MKIFGVFPGQGSQKPGMGRTLAENSAGAKQVFGRVSDATNEDLEAICWYSSEEELRDTYKAQLALFTCGMAAFAAMQERYPPLPLAFAAGHSVGEYTALTAAGAFTIEDAARTVQARARAMKRAAEKTEGAMAAIIGIDFGLVQKICEQTGGLVVPANINSPHQLVISGEIESVETAMAEAKASGARMVTRLNVSGAFHSPLMQSACDELASAIPEKLESPKIPVFSNVTARLESDPAQWRRLLVLQVVSPVKWAQITASALDLGADVQVEFGAGEVLGGLMKRLAPKVRRFRVAEAEDLALLEELIAKVT